MTRLTCYRCGATEADLDRKRCDCGEPLWFDAADAAAGFEWPESTPPADGSAPDAPAERGVWRYRDLLPVDSPGPNAGVVAAAGDTPLVRAARLDEDAGCRVWLKDERANPTGSFKDRGSAVGAARVAGADAAWLGTVSHGNMAVSVAATAAGVGASAVVLVPADVAPARLAAIAEYDPEILRVAGDYGALYRRTHEVDAPVTFLNSDAPLRVAGQKTTALEICEAFVRGAAGDGTSAPDAIVLPVSSGGHASGAWKALRELRRADLLGDDAPRLYLVQAGACDPIAAAFRADADEVTPLADPGETVAYSIANPDPPSGTRALAAARATGGAVVSVPDDEILDARSRLARDAGFAVEPSSATTLAGLRRLSASGELGAEEEVVAVLTGRGFGAASDGASPPDPETVDLAAVRDRIESLVAGT
ncbi:threonine synthase [Halorussus halobius]|uniref:threonine synthase n=1 Tax=Halorussus halobius TaxID=1710537 RepID=UPI00109243CB|nr:pyridoxal-phosphate dependent enzyme [Halorussus halobius]